MSEPTIAAVEAAAAPLLADAEKALAPEATTVLTDLHQFVAGEADRLRQELPTLVGEGVQHLHDIGSSILGRYQAVMERIDAHLTGTVTAAAPPAPAPEAPAPSTPEGSVQAPAEPVTSMAPAAGEPAAATAETTDAPPTETPATA